MNVVVFGVGSVAQNFIQSALQTGKLEPVIIVDTGQRASKQLSKFADKLKLTYQHSPDVNQPQLLTDIKKWTPHFLVSADCMRIFGAELLSCASQACINFHNGPIDTYRGLNIPSWVIWNEESRHAIDWHVMHERLDSGRILVRREFAVREDHTAYDVLVNCIKSATDSVDELCEVMLNWDNHDEITRVDGTGAYYSAKDYPEDGFVTEELDVHAIRKLIRCYSYHPLPTHKHLPKLLTGSEELVITDACVADETLPIEPNQVDFQCKNDKVRLTYRTL